ncbi:protein of unknown function [Serratia sp. Tan611]|nr:protein of unknown function [Serratia sp. Tan611]
MQKKSENHVSLIVRANATDRATSTEKTMAVWNFDFHMNSKRVLAQEKCMAGSTISRVETDLGRIYLG